MKPQRKYEFTGETKVVDGVTLQRIRRLSDGLVGGWIESEFNLSHLGSCFVYDDASVSGNAFISENAQLCDQASAHHHSRIFGNARVSGNAKLGGCAFAGDHAQVAGDAVLTMASDLVCLSGLSFHITVTPQNATIGCRTMSHAAWRKVTQSKAFEMGLFRSEYAKLKKILTILFQKPRKRR